MVKYNDISGFPDYEVNRYNIVFMPLARPPMVQWTILKGVSFGDITEVKIAQEEKYFSRIEGESDEDEFVGSAYGPRDFGL